MAAPLAAAVLVAACGQSSTTAPAPDASVPTITITSPDPGATVGSPFQVCMAATGVTIEPAGDVHPDAGHFHVIVDISPDEKTAIEAGEPAVVPKDATHVHLGDGSDCATVETTPGAHTLTALVADGAHANLNPPIVTSIDVLVENE